MVSSHPFLSPLNPLPKAARDLLKRKPCCSPAFPSSLGSHCLRTMSEVLNRPERQPVLLSPALHGGHLTSFSCPHFPTPGFIPASHLWGCPQDLGISFFSSGCVYTPLPSKPLFNSPDKERPSCYLLPMQTLHSIGASQHLLHSYFDYLRLLV